jgi:hypothetical protein
VGRAPADRRRVDVLYAMIRDRKPYQPINPKTATDQAQAA